MRRRPLAPLTALAAGALAFVPSALALDNLRPRTVADFGDVPCMQRVVRSENPLFHFDWTISEETIYPLPPGEAVQGQRFQFLAVHRQDAGSTPEWINLADVEEAQALASQGGDEIVPPPDDAVWDLSPYWPSGTWTRITPDDLRIEQSNAAAELGVDWDTSGLPVGAYQVLGYTWDPEVNVTNAREGLIKIVDDADELGPPALYVNPWEGDELPAVAEGEMLPVSLCTDAPEGSQLRAYLARPVADARHNEHFEWVPAVISDIDAGTGDHQVEVEIPELGVSSLREDHRLRIDIEDPRGQVYTAIAPRVFQVKQGDGDPPPSYEETGDGGDDDGSAGCRVDPSSGSVGLLWLLPLLAGRRRKA